MTILFQLLLAAFVLFSFVLVIGVPVAYASPSSWNQTKPLLFLGSLIWLAFVIVIGILNAFDASSIFHPKNCPLIVSVDQVDSFLDLL